MGVGGAYLWIILWIIVTSKFGYFNGLFNKIGLFYGNLSDFFGLF